MRDTIEMAREAGLQKESRGWSAWTKDLQSFEALVRADAIADERDKWMERTAILIRGEREACAKVCEDRMGPTATAFYGNTYAAAIRARGETK